MYIEKNVKNLDLDKWFKDWGFIESIGNFEINLKPGLIGEEFKPNDIAMLSSSWDGFKKMRKEFKNVRTIKKIIPDVYNDAEEMFNEVFSLLDIESESNLKKSALYEKIKIALEAHFIGEGYATRVGMEIKQPNFENLENDYMKILLDLVRIMIEELWNHYGNYLKEPGDELLIKEKKAGNIAESIYGVIATGITSQLSGINFFGFTIPDEMIKIINLIFAVSARKITEYGIENS